MISIFNRIELGVNDDINWQPRSCDLTSLDYLVFEKSTLCPKPKPTSNVNIRTKIDNLNDEISVRVV